MKQKETPKYNFILTLEITLDFVNDLSFKFQTSRSLTEI